jgi:class 3 adenylate cyclase
MFPRRLVLLTKLLTILHKYPVSSISLLFAVGMALIFGDMIYLSNKINQELAIRYMGTYIDTLSTVQSMYSSEVVERLSYLGITPRQDYRNHDGAIPFPATFAIELAKAMTNPETGITNRLYSDYPFLTRKDGGPKDEYESLALSTLRFAKDKTKPFIRFENYNNRMSMRYGKAVVMKQSCVDCHNTHPDSTKKDWKVGDVRGVREVIVPMRATRQIDYAEWGATVGVMLFITISGLGILFLVINALKASIAMLSKTNVAYDRFVPHEFLGYLKKQSIIDVKLSDSVEKQMTVLFSDIRNFTRLSESMTPEENFMFVNSYYSVMGPVVRKHHGFVDKYIGDGMMALFDRTDDAVNAAIEMLAKLKEYNMKTARERPEPLRIGIGLHKGKLRLGTVGELNRMDGTVISDAVNLASRIEGLTKLYGAQILITETIFRSIEEVSAYRIRLMDKVKVTGRQEPIIIYEVFSGDQENIKLLKLALKKDFEQAIALYQVKEFGKARELFKEYLAQFPDDKPAQLYLKRCERYVVEGVPEDWNGTFVLYEKKY